MSVSFVENNNRKESSRILKYLSDFIYNRLLAVVILIIAWEVLARLFSIDGMLPPFSKVLDTFVNGILFPLEGTSPYGASGSVPLLLYHAASSLLRVGAGFALAVLIGVPLGFIMGLSKRVYTNIDPIVSMLRPVPPIAWIPLAILWFGLGVKPTIFIIFIGTFFPIVLSTLNGVRGTPIRLLEYAKVLGANKMQIVTKVVVYEAVPYIVTGMRVGFGIGWMSVVAAEMIAATSGLGYLIMTARWIFATDMVMAGMLMIGLIGFAGDLLLRAVERYFAKWRVALVMDG